MAAPGGYSARVDAEPVAPQIGLISLPELALLGTEVSNVVVSRRPACEPNVGPALQCWNGSNWAKGTRYRAMRVMFPLYATAFQFVAHKRVAAKSLDNFAGLRIGGGPRGGTSGAYVEHIFKVLGIPALVQHGAWDNLGQQLAERELDGAVAAIGAPFPALAQLEQTVDFIAPSPEQIAGIRKQLPEITPSTIAAGTYRSLVKDYPTIGLYNFAVAHKDLSEDLTYRIVKAAFDHHA